MATITVTKGYNNPSGFVSGEVITPAKLNSAQSPTVALTTETIVNADVSPSAAIALSKLATGALPAAITVTTANVVDASITAAKLDGAQTGSAPIYGCRAWVNFDGTRDATGAASTANTNRFIRGSGNVASVLRNTLGTYTITFTTAMPDANYAQLVTTGTTGTSSNAIIGYELDIASRSTSSVRIACGNNEIDQFTESPQVTVAIFR